MGRVPPNFSVSTHLQHEMVRGMEVCVGVCAWVASEIDGD